MFLTSDSILFNFFVVFVFVALLCFSFCFVLALPLRNNNIKYKIKFSIEETLAFDTSTTSTVPAHQHRGHTMFTMITFAKNVISYEFIWETNLMFRQFNTRNYIVWMKKTIVYKTVDENDIKCQAPSVNIHAKYLNLNSMVCCVSISFDHLSRGCCCFALEII